MIPNMEIKAKASLVNAQLIKASILYFVDMFWSTMEKCKINVNIYNANRSLRYGYGRN